MDEVQVDDIEREFADVDINNDSSPLTKSVPVGSTAENSVPVVDHQHHEDDETVTDEEEDEEEKVPTPTPISQQNNGFSANDPVIHVSLKTMGVISALQGTD